MHVWQTDGKIDLETARMSVPNYDDLRAQSQAFDDFGGYYYGTFVLGGDTQSQTVSASWLTPNLLDVLGVRPAMGRGFQPEDATAGEVVLLSHDYWQRAMAGRSDVLDQTLLLDDRPYRVVGVMPPDFVFPFNRMDMWVPLDLEPYREQRGQNGPLLVVGRMAQGETPESAQTELSTLMTRLESEHPTTNDQVGANIQGLRSQLLFTWDTFVVVFPALLLAVGFVILIVCANLGSLILARAQERAHEMAFRLTLGADRRRLVRQLLTENTLLAGAGGALGLVLAGSMTRGIEQAMPGELYRVGGIGIDLRALGFALAVALGSVLVFGLAPALQSTSVNLSAAVKEGSWGSSAGVSRRRLRNLFVVVQVALAVLLVTGAGLMVKTFMTLQQVDLGFEQEQLLTFEVTLPASKYPGDPEETAYFEQVVEKAAAVPGVSSAASIYPLPLNHESLGATFEVEGREPVAGEQLFANTFWVSPEWLDVARTPVLSGRGIERGDGPDAPPVVLVNREMAERIWPGESPIGQRLLVRDVSREVVGVVENSVYYDLDEATPMVVYYPQSQYSTRRRFVMVRTAGDPMATWPSVEAAVRPVDPSQPLETVRSMRDVVAVWLGPWMMGIGGLSALGVGALALAAIGLYGMIRYSVGQRMREFGIRHALGAASRDIVQQVLLQGLRLVAVGLAIGLAAALGLTRFLQSLLFGVEALDPVTFLVTPALIVAVAVLACWGPARRAVRADPIVALRQD